MRNDVGQTLLYSAALIVAGGLLVQCGGDATEPPTAMLPPTAPSNLRMTVLDSTVVRLSWRDNSASETGFRIQHLVHEPGAQWGVIAEVGEDVTTFEAVTLRPATKHSFCVDAFNAAGSTSSITVTGITPPVAEIALSPDSLTFTSMSGLVHTAVDTVLLTNRGEDGFRGLSATAALSSRPDSSPWHWLAVENAGFSLPTELVVRASAWNLDPGEYWADVLVTSSNASNSPQRIPVSFSVAPVISRSVVPGGGPKAMALSAGDVILVATRGADSHPGYLVRIDPPYIAAGLSTRVRNQPLSVASDPAGTTAYVTGWRSGIVDVVDLAFMTKIDSISVTGSALAVIMSRDGNRLYVSTSLDTLYVIDPSGHSIQARIHAWGPMDQLVIHPNLDRVYATAYHGYGVTEFEADSVRRWLEVLERPRGIAFTRDGNTMYVTHEFAPLGIVDLATGELTSAPDATYGGEGVAVSPDGFDLYVAIPDSGYVLVLDRQSLEITQYIRHYMPSRVTCDSSGSVLLLMDKGASTLDVINRERD